MYKQEFQTLIKKYLDGDISVKELKKLVNYYESFQETNTWVEELGAEEDLKNRMLISILESIDNDSTPVKKISFYKKNNFKYGVVATLLVLFGLGLFYKESFTVTADRPALVEQQIQIGSSKAILTLADGTDVELLKGEKFQSGSAKSDGEALVYENDSKLKKEIAYNFLSVPRGGQFFIKLEDGTRVWLNSESKIKYPEAFKQGEDRKVELVYGEAYFDVSPSTAHNGSRFKIFANNQEIEVLGTEFNVKAYRDEPNIYTTLVEGSIQLKTSDNEIEKLEPGQQSILNKLNDNIIISKVETHYETAWIRGVFSFNDKSLEEIMLVLSRWYDVNIVFQDEELKNIKFNGQLKKDQDLESILNLIKNTNFIAAYDIKKDKIILKK